MLPWTKNNFNLLFLVLIIVLGFTLRIWKLDNFLGDSFSQDEAVRGYDAYSLLETGKDHRGNAWPLYFEGFSDKRDNYAPLYVYVLLPFVKILGLSEFSVRLPAVIFGTLTIPIVYFLAEELFQNRKIALLAGFILAISSWHIFLSRVGMEVIIIPFIVSLALLMFIKWINSGKKIFLILSSVVWAISLYSYSTAKLFIPLILVGLAYFYRKEILRSKKIFVSCVFIIVILAAPLITYNIGHWDKIQGRFNEISILYNPHEEGHNEFSLFKTHNQYWIFEFAKNYIDSTLLVYLIPLFSLSYELIFVAIGFFYLLRNQKYELHKNLLLYWFLTAPIPAALTNTNPHILRNTTIMPLAQILIAVGILYFINTVNALMRRADNKIGFALIFLVIPATFVKLSIPHFSYLEKTNFNPPNFIQFNQYGFKRISAYLKEKVGKYDTILFTDKANQPYIFILFYLSWPPADVQSRPPIRYYEPADNGWQRVGSFDKFKFCDPDSCFQNNSKTLVIARRDELLGQDINIMDQWQNPDGTNWKIMSVK